MKLTDAVAIIFLVIAAVIIAIPVTSIARHYGAPVVA